MYTLTRRQREVLATAVANGGSIAVKKTGATELNELIQRSYISVVPAARPDAL